MRSALYVLLALLMAGCGKNAVQTTTTEPLPEPQVAPRKRERPWDDFETRLIKVFEDGILVSEKGHPGGEPALLYASPWAADALRRLARGEAIPEFRTGSLIVLHHADGTLYVMRKRPLGRFPDTKDWYFALVREGRVVLESGTPLGKVAQEACADCHATMAPKSDWVVPPRLR